MAEKYGTVAYNNALIRDIIEDSAKGECDHPVAGCDGKPVDWCRACRATLWLANIETQSERTWGEENCGCQSCQDQRDDDWFAANVRLMVLCPNCGNKRCPYALSHEYQCSGSNEPGQTPVLRTTPTPQE